MDRIRLGSIILALALGFASVSAQAVPVTVTIENINTDPFGPVGSFSVDPKHCSWYLS